MLINFLVLVVEKKSYTNAKIKSSLYRITYGLRSNTANKFSANYLHLGKMYYPLPLSIVYYPVSTIHCLLSSVYLS